MGGRLHGAKPLNMPRAPLLKRSLAAGLDISQVDASPNTVPIRFEPNRDRVAAVRAARARMGATDWD